MSSLDSNSFDDRLELWKRTYQLFLEKPLLGHGANQWNIKYLKFGLSDLNYSIDNSLRHYFAHNYYLETLAELGIIGFSLLVLLLFIIGKSYFSSNKRIGIIYIFLSYLICLSFYGEIHHHLNRISNHQILFFFLIGFLIKFKSVKRTRFYFNVIIIILNLICLGWFSFNYEVIKIENLLLKNKKEDVYLSRVKEKLNTYHIKNLNEFIFNEPIETYLSKICQKQNKIDSSKYFLKESLNRNPYLWYNWYELGKNYEKQNDSINASICYENSLNLNNNFYKAYVSMIRINQKSKLGLQLNIHNEIIYPRILLFNSKKEAHENVSNKYFRKFCKYHDQLLKVYDNN